MSKKGDSDFLKVFFGLLLGMVILYIFFVVEGSLLTVFSEHDDNVDYINMIKDINSLNNNDKKETIYYINSKNFLVGFEPNQREVQGIEKPSSCEEDKVCLCKCLKEYRSCSTPASVCNNLGKDILYLTGVYTGPQETTRYFSRGSKEYIENKGLYIEGKNKLILDLIRQDSELSIIVPQQK